MSLQLNWQLPAMYRTEDILSKISWDGQVYFACKQCSWEERYDPIFVSNDLYKDFSMPEMVARFGLAAFFVSGNTYRDVSCRQCHARGIYLIRHLEQCSYNCEDCNRSFQVETTGFETIRCPHCLSTHLTLLSQKIVPPFPPRFGAGAVAKEHPWGESAKEDFEKVDVEIRGMNQHLEFPSHLLWSIRFWRRLRLYGGYEDTRDRSIMLNAEGGWLREYFKRTGEIPAGLEALALYQESVRVSDEPIQRALAEHNVSMAIYSLLAQYSEDYISFLTDRPNIKKDGIAAAERALAVYESDPYRNIGGILTQKARVYHTLGDLLKVSNINEADLKQAIEYFNGALDYNALPANLAMAVRESRATAISLMDDPAPTLRSQAIEDLKEAISLDESNRGWSTRWIPLHNLAELYINGGQLREALPFLERAAALALNEIEMVVDPAAEATLLQKSEFYVKVFERLTWLYIALNKVERGLACLETLRAATIHLYTLSDRDKKRKAQIALSRIKKTLLASKPLHTQVKPLQLEPLNTRIAKLMQYLKDIQTAFVSFTTYGNKDVTAIVIIPKKFLIYEIKAFEWEAQAKAKLLKAQFYLDPSPLRETRLQHLCQIGYEMLFAPLLPLLEKSGIERVAISAPGILSHFPFEAFKYGEASAHFVKDQFRIFYLPSLTLGYDLMGSRKQSGAGRLLIVGYQGDDLPDTQLEMKKLQELWEGKVTLLEGEACTKKRVLSELGDDYDYIHFTCHGSFNPLIPLDSALHLVPNAERDSQRITASDILGVRFQHNPVITLSACSSALTSYNDFNDCTGLTGSFLRIGARCIIGSRWPVYDRIAAQFMIELYEMMYKKDTSPLHCLYEVQSRMSKSFGIEDWAAFSYLGLP